MQPNLLLLLSTFFIALASGGFFVFRNWKLMKTAQPWQTNAPAGERVKSVIVNVLLQKKLMKRPLRGIFHIFIFFGFFVYVVHTFSQIIGGLTGDYFFYIPELLGSGFLALYENLLDIFTVLVIAGCLYFWIRRYIFLAPELDRPSVQSIIVIGMILLLMIFTLLETPARTILDGGESSSFLRPLFAKIVYAIGVDKASEIFLIGWWGHLLTIFAFMIVVPQSKHAHLLWAPLNYWFTSTESKGKMPGLDVENAKFWGAANVHEFSWKNYLDSLSCIECGRCELRCPASRTEKPLSPKNIMVDLKHALMDKMPRARAALAGSGAVSDAGTGSETNEQKLSESGEFKVLDAFIKREAIWACTSCYACVEACPVGNNQLEPIYKMRQAAVLNEGAMPAQLQNALQNMENQSNPWGISSEKREEWTEGMEVKTMRQWAEAGDTPEILYWVGCAGAFDDRNKKIARSIVKILNKAGVKFGILGTEENCTGDSARRAGNEYLFQTLAQTNIETLNGYGVKKIITPCPHCFNTLKNEYPEFGGNYEVTHHSEFIQSLIKENKIKLKSKEAQKLTYHDSCYLGRYNELYSAPRELASCAGNLSEAIDHNENSTCCGAGGAQMWMEETGKRVNLMRTQQLLNTGASGVATACPFCITMITDAVKAEGKSEEVSVLDVAELVEKQLE